MTSFAARISRVRMKDGASVTILPTAMPHTSDGKPDNWRGRLIDHAKHIAEMDEAGSMLDGFVIIGLFSDGKSSLGCRLPDRIPTCLIPAYVAELLRRDVVTEREAERVFDRRFEWVG